MQKPSGPICLSLTELSIYVADLINDDYYTVVERKQDYAQFLKDKGRVDDLERLTTAEIEIAMSDYKLEDTRI